MILYRIAHSYRPVVVAGLEQLAVELGTTVHGAKMAVATRSHKGRAVTIEDDVSLRRRHIADLRKYFSAKNSGADQRKRPNKDPMYYIEHVLGYEQQWQIHVASGYSTATIPSLDRINAALGYDLNNLRWMGRAENLQKGRTEDRTTRTWKLEGSPRNYRSRAQAERASKNRGSYLLPTNQRPEITLIIS